MTEFKYIVKGRPIMHIAADGTRQERAEEDRCFTTAAGLLHWAIREGAFSQRFANRAVATPDELHLSARRDVGADYHRIDTFFRWKIEPEHLDAMYRALTRFKEIVHYLREVEPEWVKGEEIHYMDNSVERHDTDKYGNTRRVIVKSPSGDLCF